MSAEADPAEYRAAYEPPSSGDGGFTAPTPFGAYEPPSYLPPMPLAPTPLPPTPLLPTTLPPLAEVEADAVPTSTQPSPITVPPPSYGPAATPRSPHPPRRPAGPRVGGRRTVLVIAAVLVAVVAMGGLSAVVTHWRWTPSSTVPSTSGPSPTPAPASTQPVAPTPAPLVSASGLVEVDADLVGDPRAQTVLALLDRHFTAINNRDYGSWAATVAPVRSQDESSDTWQRAYQSTTDSAVAVTTLTSSGPDSIVAGLRFTSTQDVGDAPTDLRVTKICWSSQWPISSLSAGGRIEAPPAHTTHYGAC